MKKTKPKLIILFLITLIILYFILKDDYKEIIEVLLNSNIFFIILLIITFFIGDVFKSFSVAEISKKIDPRYKFKDGFMLTLKTNFFNGITPFSLGGQPFQLYSLKKTNDIDYVSGADILFEDFYVFQMALMILTIIFITINGITRIVAFNDIATKFLIVGFIINFSIALVLIFLPYINDKNHKFEKFVTKIAFGLKLAKTDKKTFENNLIEKIDLFKSQIKKVREKPILVFKCIVLNMLKLLTFGLCAFFAVKAVNDSVSLFTCCAIVVLVTTMASFIPIPGASGGTEYCFVLLFSAFMVDTKVMPVLILWRFATYYLPIIVGGIAFAIWDGKKI